MCNCFRCKNYLHLFSCQYFIALERNGDFSYKLGNLLRGLGGGSWGRAMALTHGEELVKAARQLSVWRWRRPACGVWSGCGWNMSYDIWAATRVHNRRQIGNRFFLQIGRDKGWGSNSKLAAPDILMGPLKFGAWCVYFMSLVILYDKIWLCLKIWAQNKDWFISHGLKSDQAQTHNFLWGKIFIFPQCSSWKIWSFNILYWTPF